MKEKKSNTYHNFFVVQQNLHVKGDKNKDSIKIFN